MPRVFISSTFYDLKYAREYISDFIEDYGFQPIRSEAGDIAFIPGENLDISCYQTMKSADMVILIIGGRYGSPASDQSDDGFGNYVSVTRREFNTAKNNNIPIFVFVDHAVYAEYLFYKKNIRKIEDDIIKGVFEFDFVATDSINVFKFIDEVFVASKIPVMEFSKISEVKIILKKQFSGLFKEYLVERKNNKKVEEIVSSVDIIENQLNRLLLWVDKIGKKEYPNEAEEIQKRQIIEECASTISNNFQFVSLLKEKAEIESYLSFFVEKLMESLIEDKRIIDHYFSSNSDDISFFDSFFEYDGVIISEVKCIITLDDIKMVTEIDNYKERIVQRLLDNDCLRKMGFLN